MDEESKELVAVVAEAGVRGFLETIAAPLVEAGDWGADIIRRRRLKTQIKTLVLAKRMLDDAGLQPRAVSPKLLVPLLENASLEDDPEEAVDPEAAESMQRRWAALLANAAAGERGASVGPGFPGMLSELEAIEARILDTLAGQRPEARIDTSSLAVSLGLAMEDEPVRIAYWVHLDNLERLKLCTVRRKDSDLEALYNYLSRDEHNPFGTGRAIGTPRIPRPERADLVFATELGRAFVRACTPPDLP